MTAPRDRAALGRGVAQLIPPVSADPVQQAAAALSGLATATVPVAVLHAALLLLEATACRSEDDKMRAVAERTTGHLRNALNLELPHPAPATQDRAPGSPWFAAPLSAPGLPYDRAWFAAPVPAADQD
ncbi:hypothetical protein ACIQZO_04745 [Streptomyces sp. NPDC097617]|uniref:hypothetical protein n=1 Tax=Streptomyces sp. NPDC097617 TaxID=3366091 RepID=UPI0037F16E86